MRHTTTLDTDWRFTKSDPAGAEMPDCDDSAWDVVCVPHDWAIAGPFDKKNDLQETTILEDGEVTPTEHSGRTGGLPHVGRGWYRRTFGLPVAEAGRRVFLEFDGIMANSKVWVNGAFAGTWPYGYSSFSFDISDHVRFGGKNVIAVSVDVKPVASRWYPGAGIYRHVRLLVVDPVYVPYCGTFVTTPEVTPGRAAINVRTEIAGAGSDAVVLKTDIVDPGGSVLASESTAVSAGSVVEQAFSINDPQLWSTTTPHLYKAVSTLEANGRPIDLYETTFGIRSIRFDSRDGFFLNGQPLHLKGVCMHHDLGPLGAAVNRSAIERQFTLLVEMGCNALRTAHNPPAPELLDVCDRLGILVIDEAFDEWKTKKCENGYNILFDEWAEKDMRALVRRDRNHPSVIMWSIGNEIPDQGTEIGAGIARFLVDICHEEDQTRPTTSGFNDAEKAIENGLAEVVDVPGWNYRPGQYRSFHEAQPAWPMYGSETESCVSSRGEYHFPAEEKRVDRMDHPSGQVSSYDMTAPSWGYAPDVEFAAQDECPFMCGEFVWTGFDYLGEPTPYNDHWPSRSAYFGIVDLCGIPKDRFYLYRSHWRPGVETLHILPHWNWEGREGEITPVHCYTSYDAAELFLNGTSLGKRRKDPDSRFDRYRLRWSDVRYEPGTLRVVALDGEGNPVAETEMKTAGAPARLEIRPDRTSIRAEDKELAFLAVRIVDEHGTLCPLADDEIRFTVEGAGRIVAVGNGDATSLESFVADRRRAFHGQCMLIIGASGGDDTGAIKVRASSGSLEAADSTVSVKREGT